MNTTDIFAKNITGLTDNTRLNVTVQRDVPTSNFSSNISFVNTTANAVTEEIPAYQHFVFLHPYFVYGVIIVGAIGITGNISMVFALVRERLTSFTLLVCCLSVSDSCLIGSLAAFGFVVISDFWDLGRFADISIQPFIGTSSGFAALIWIERSIAVLKPVWYRQNWTKCYTVTMVVTVTVINITFEVGREIFFLLSGELSSSYLRIADQTIRRFVPFLCIAAANVGIAVGLYRSQKVRTQMSSSAKTEAKTIKTAFILIMMYFFCMIPGSTSLLLIDYNVYNEEQIPISGMVSIGLEVINASVNFVVYALSNSTFRKTFVERICCCCKQKQHKPIMCDKAEKEDDTTEKKY